MFLMPAIRLTVSKRYALFISSITFNGEIINPCSCCVKKGLVYITIIKPSGYQPSSCSECTKLNTCMLYNMRSVSLNKCTFFTYFNSL